MVKKEQGEIATWVYAGFRKIDNGKKKGHLFFTWDFDKQIPDLEDSQVYAASGKGWQGSFTIGCLYEVELTEQGCRGIPHWTGKHYQDKDKTLKWSVESKSIEEGFRLANKEKAMKDSPLHEALQPIKDAMRGLTPIERAALLSWVIRQLMK